VKVQHIPAAKLFFGCCASESVMSLSIVYLPQISPGFYRDPSLKCDSVGTVQYGESVPPLLGVPRRHAGPRNSASASVARTFVPYIYSRSQIRALLTQCRVTQAKSRFIDAQTFQLFLLTLYATGARVGEVRNLRVSDLDLQHRKALFRSGSPEKERCIPINADLSHQLRVLLPLRHREP
jgi:integrase